MSRKSVFSYAEKHYKTLPDYPWKNDSESAVLRHRETRKWYGLVMKISKKKLGLPDNEMCDVLNVKCDPLLSASLRSQEGIFPAYHMNHTEWITILLDGTVPDEKVFNLLDLSYTLTAPKKGNSKI